MITRLYGCILGLVAKNKPSRYDKDLARLSIYMGHGAEGHERKAQIEKASETLNKPIWRLIWEALKVAHPTHFTLP